MEVISLTFVRLNFVLKKKVGTSVVVPSMYC